MAVMRRDTFEDVKPTDFMGEFKAREDAAEKQKLSDQSYKNKKEFDSQNRIAENKFKSEATLYNKKKEQSLMFHMDKLRKSNGILKGAPKAQSSVGGALANRQTRVGGYKTPTEVPGNLNGVPLDSVRMDPATGTYVPNYRNKKEDSRVAMEKYKAEIAKEEREFQKENPTLSERPFEYLGKSIGGTASGVYHGAQRAFNSAKESIGSVGKALSGRGERDYNSLSEGQLYRLARRGDKQAVEIGKRKFAK